MKPALRLVAVIALALVAVPGASAEPQKKKTPPPGALSGVVLGPDDRPVSRARIAYQSSSGIEAHIVRADSRGQFTIPKLRPDNYDVRASGKGVFSEWEKNVSVQPGQVTKLTLRLIYAKEIPKAYVKSKPSQQP